MNEATAITTLPTTSPSGELIMTMPKHVAEVVPFEDHAVYHNLSLQQKQRVSLLLQIFAEMRTAPDGPVAAADRLAVVYAGNGCSASNLKTLYYRLRRKGWKSLAKIYAKPNQKLPAEFVQEFKRRVEASKRERTTAAVMEEIKHEWAAGKPVEGYGTWQEYFRYTRPLDDLPPRWPYGYYPQGWSESNLYTKQSNKAQRAFARRGYAALQRYIPHVVRDTSTLRPLELITIDDFELDFLIRAFNPVRQRWETCRCAGLLAMDVATRRVLAVALVPRFKLSKRERALAPQHIAANADVVEGEAETADEKRTRISVTRHDVQSLLHVVFSTFGRPADYGCTILCENAAAAITPDFEIALELLLGVQVARTGLIDGKTLTNGFSQGGGKPWQKGWIEALFRTIWNRLGATGGYKGADYTQKPADHDALVAYAEKLFKLPQITPELAAQFRLGLLTVEEALGLLHAVFARIEQRDEHRMIGFADHFVYQLPGEAGLLGEEAIQALPQDQQLQAVPLPRRETPVQRWERLIAQCQRVNLDPATLACLLLTPKRVTLRNLRLTFTHAGKGYTFADADSPVMRLPDGTELLGYFDPTGPGVLHVTDLKGNVLGKVRRRGAIDIRDHVAISAEAGEIAHLVHACVTAPVRERHAAENARLASDNEHNVRLQLEAGIEQPVRITPEKLSPPETAPGESHEKPMAITAEVRRTPAKSDQVTARAGLSHKLSAPARDAFAPNAGHALAQGISTEVAASDQRAALERQARADAEHLSADDIEAATGRRPVEATPPEPQFSPDEISDLLRD